MKRMHVHIGVADLDASIRHYSALFGAAPSVQKDDYAKWLMDDPQLNFAISSRVSETGIEHLGMQLDDESELASVASRLQQAESETRPEAGAHCCYARSEKEWAKDPDGVEWEFFVTHGEAETFGQDRPDDLPAKACCAPA